ncbi:hypothetical protein FOA43_001285 [Brettanomyces nanus]|uniref:Phosphatidylethanolamine-binding protein n=1 Tax=Eeniella nana TaxID=13502 RepID=A0A875S2A9_EENNA|nr:uncharacterized protein FOA43_001285 [Brettanomyces nanus]QPG73969.1 hypothetical protein FOA43_001285 [Brettanomyces nanus]
MSLALTRTIWRETSFATTRRLLNFNCIRSQPFANYFRRPVLQQKLQFSPKPILFLSAMPLMTISDSIMDSLTKSEVIPTVIHDKSFVPKGFLTIKYDTGKEVTMGNNIKPSDAQSKPRIDFTLNLPSDSSSSLKISKGDKFTLVFTDPDAPSRGNETWSEYCHWILVDVKLNTFDDTAVNAVDTAENQLTTENVDGTELFSYVGPGCPPKTGKHRYVFLLYKQKSGVVPKVPEGRRNWGTGVPGYGAAEYAEKWGLTLYGVNFFYARNEIQ